MRKEWVLDSNISKEKSLVKRLLISRGIKTEEEIHEFLNPLEMDITSPIVFTDMEKAIERLSRAIDSEEVIIIYGDFDADGVTSTSVLYKTLKYLGANVHYFIPDRENEGHGFDKKALIKLMTTVKPKVIISVDCGISDVDAVNFINTFKTIDVIITDHHEAPEELPKAYAIINPKAPNALDENLSSKQIEYLTYLAGCGVAFKVAQALLIKYEKTEFVYEILPFVAVGTVADVVPLLGENRYFVTKGLELISRGKHYGLKRLLESAGFDITKGITSENIAFGVAPRINASGRLDTVDAA
ncbi:DHH family phosphoesterase, partial [bacterium]|nr:DHH family phosphoesterase [bacterium]